MGRFGIMSKLVIGQLEPIDRPSWNWPVKDIVQGYPVRSAWGLDEAGNYFNVINVSSNLNTGNGQWSSGYINPFLNDQNAVAGRAADTQTSAVCSSILSEGSLSLATLESNGQTLVNNACSMQVSGALA